MVSSPISAPHHRKLKVSLTLVPQTSRAHACSVALPFQLFVTPWIAACQAPLSTESYRQEYWSGLQLPSPPQTWWGVYVQSLSCVRLSAAPRTVPRGLLCPWNSPGRNTGAGCHFPLQGTFPAQGWNPRLLCPLHWQAYSLPPVPLGNPNIVIQVKSRLPFDCLQVSA